MRQWEVYSCEFPGAGVHPAIVISSDERSSNDGVSQVNVLIGVSVRAGRPLKKHEVVLDESDGLDWGTAVRCDVVHLAAKRDLKSRRGSVSLQRRKVLAQKLIECFRF